MTQQAAWSTLRGPFSNNAAFEADVRPPLVSVWEHEVTGEYNDGAVVGGQGVAVVPTRGQDVECLSLADGRLRWSQRRVRGKESECFVAAGRCLAAGKSVQRPVVIDLETGEVQQGKFTFVPQGTFEDEGGEAALLCRDGVVTPGSLEWRETQFCLYGRVSSNSFYGWVEPAEGGAPPSDPALARLSLPAMDAVWSVPLNDGATESVISVGAEVVGTYSDTKNELRARDAADGSLLWTVPESNTAHLMLPFLISDKVFIHWSNWDLVARHPKTGEALWRYSVTDKHSNAVLTGSIVWLAVQERSGGRLIAIEAESGRPLWEQRTRAKPGRYAVAVLDDSLVCRFGARVVCYRSDRAA